MEVERKEVRDLLPEREQGLFDDIVLQRVLGVSGHIRMIGEMFLSLADKAEHVSNDPETLERELMAVADFFKRTRGEASMAVGNAVQIMIARMGSFKDCTLQEAVLRVQRSVKTYARHSEEEIQKVADYGVNVASAMKTILVFDYSSTVNEFLKRLGRLGTEIEVYIPESRTIDGGHAFVPTALNAKMKVHFIPDAAILYFLRRCEGAFFGAETLYADGTVYNTTGSDLVGLSCRSLQIPLYVLSPMVKLDIRPVRGYHRRLVINDLKERLAWDGMKADEGAKVNFTCPELLAVEGDCIKGIITEFGVVPPGAIYSLALEYSKGLGLEEKNDE